MKTIRGTGRETRKLHRISFCVYFILFVMIFMARLDQIVTDVIGIDLP